MGSEVSSWKNCLPGWWFARYISVFVLFAVVAVVLISSTVPPAAAVLIPITWSAAAIAVVRWLDSYRPVAVSAGLLLRHQRS